MKAMTYIMLGVVGAMAYQKMSESNHSMMKDMRKMMKHNKTMKMIREIF